MLATVAATAVGVGGLHDGALAHLDGQRGDEAVDGPLGIGVRAAPSSGVAARIEATALACGRDFARDVLQLRGLVAEHDELGAPATSALSASASPPTSRGQRVARGSATGSAHSTGRPHPRASARAMLPAADQTDLHTGSRLEAGRAAGPARSD